MQQQADTRPIVRPEDIAEVWEIVQQMTKRKVDKPKPSVWIQKLDQVILVTQESWVAGYVVLLLITALLWLLPSWPLGATALAIVALVTLLIQAMLVLVIIRGTPSVVSYVKRPTETILELVDQASRADLSATNRLARCEREAIEYVLAQFLHQRLAFEARGSMLGGQLEKVGMFPALAASAGGAIVLFNSSYPWLRGLIFVVLAMYFLKFFSYGVTQEMDRVIALLKYSLEARNRIEKTKAKQIDNA
ncbi:hypothetical protein [Cupriavidus pauculus]|uniref:hypothetical protein n=1 Tax=Cupriavidus pauculus TaxID=82633 RepID=UPI001EE243AF|nr:hypothetical protein [Cupriavidus pauculus]GJG98554.1 hypothetical protein CBA19C6_28715 [Cupriavidus pauculus]